MKNELIQDLEKATNLEGMKELQTKYGTASKRKADIQLAILERLRELRFSATEFGMEDVRHFAMFDWGERNIVNFLEKESVKFIEILKEHYLHRIMSAKTIQHIGKDKFTGFSTADKYLISIYNKIKGCLEPKIDTTELQEKLKSELKDFEVKILEAAEEYAKKQYQRIEQEYTKVQLLLSQEYEQLTKDFNTISKLESKRTALKTKLCTTLNQFIEKIKRDVQDKFNYDVRVLACKLLEHNLSIENIKCLSAQPDPKHIEITVTDSNTTLYCCSILAAEYSSYMIPHFRFIITAR